MSALLYPEGFISTTLTTDINASTTVIPLDDLPVRVTSGYLVIEPLSSTKREVVFFTSVGASSVTAADDTTDGNDATGRGCLGSITVGANTNHAQGVSVIIASVEQYWKRLYDVFTEAHNTDGTHKSGSVFTLPQINDTTADHQYIFAVSELTADRTVTLPLLTGNDEFVFKDHTQTLTNKTLTAPVIDQFGTASGLGAAWDSYDVTLTNMTLGNGTKAGSYKKIGKTVFFKAKFTFGASGSAMGSNPAFSLPATAVADAPSQCLAIITDSGTAAYRGPAALNSTTAVTGYSYSVSGALIAIGVIGATAPMTWAVGDSLLITGWYEAA